MKEQDPAAGLMDQSGHSGAKKKKKRAKESKTHANTCIHGSWVEGLVRCEMDQRVYPVVPGCQAGCSPLPGLAHYVPIHVFWIPTVSGYESRQTTLFAKAAMTHCMLAPMGASLRIFSHAFKLGVSLN